MAVEDAEAPGRKHQQTSAREQNFDQSDGEIPLLAGESGHDRIDQVWGGEDADQHQQRNDERQEGDHRSRHPAGLSVVLVRQQPGVDGNK